MLNSRYYNPEWGRFINADGFISTGQGLLSHNMYAYCNNNPVNMKDKNGTWGIGLISLLFVAVVLVLYTCTIIENNADTSGGELIQDIVDNLPTINLETKTTTTTKTTTETITKTKDKDDEEVYI